jgi:hypothetical protein
MTDTDPVPSARSRNQAVRMAAGLALILASLALFGYQFVKPARVAADGPSQRYSASIMQQRRNLVASNGPVLLVPTRTKIEISAPRTMEKGDSGHVQVIVTKYTEVADLFSNAPKAIQLQPVKYANRDTEVRLVSAAFDTGALAQRKEGAPYPLRYDWSIVPKSEGRHMLLLDLSDVMDTARGDSEVSGKTSVTIDNRSTELKEGVNLQLDIAVTGAFGLPPYLINVLSGLPAFAGFVLTYPLVVKWLEGRRRVRRRRLNGTP